MSQAQGQKIGACGRKDAWKVYAEDLYSPRSDPKHEEHAAWKARTDPSDPDMIALVSSMLEIGTDEGMPVVVYRDGERVCVAAGDRRTAACIIANEHRKAKRLPRLWLNAVTTRDPVLARNLENARKNDPPMVLARRYASSASVMGDAAAAASLCLRLDYANTLRKCLALPLDVQEKVNACEVPPDVAVRAGAKGGDKAREVIESARDAGTGKVDPKRARAAAKEAVPSRPKTRPAKVLTALEANLSQAMAARGDADAGDEALMVETAREVVAWVKGGPTPGWLMKYIPKAGKQAEAVE